MKTYEVTSGAAKIYMGVVAVTPEQFKRRAHNLEKVSKGKFKVLSPIYFKKGEKFGYDGEMPKALAVDLKESGEAISDDQPTTNATDPKDSGTGD